MRTIHFVKPSGSSILVPLCGAWGAMDTHWTEDAAGVTCAACLEARSIPTRPAAVEFGAAAAFLS